MNKKNKFLFIILIFFLLSNLANSKINLQIVMKINNEIVTSYDIEQEINYLMALNSQLREIDQEKLIQIAKRSITKEIIRKNEILKYKKLNLDNPNIEPILNNLSRNLNFTNQNDFSTYLKKFNLTIDELKKKIEIEDEWKGLVYSKYIKSVKIDKEELNKKIQKLAKNEFQIEYDLSEIIFEKKSDTSLDDLINKIKDSIESIGFQNTANLYSISDSAKVGGKIGWVKNRNLAVPIISALKNLKENEYSSPIQIGNNLLILKINRIKKTPLEIDKEKELNRMVLNETTKQLNKYSNIFYNKIKLNSIINEF
tara:strand:- start:150 stop:1085 length:936 start_codon:yes stop_codon:yes gene_type:complete